MLFDHVARDREPETGAPAANPHAVDLVEALEDPRPIGRRDADAVVLDRENDLVTGGPDGDPDLGHGRCDRSGRRTAGLGRLAKESEVLGTRGIRERGRRACADGEPVLGAAELQRVVDEVHDDLAEPRLVTAYRRHPTRNVDDEAQPLALGEQPQPLGRVRRHSPEIDIVEQDEWPAALDPGEGEQLVDHLDEMPGLDLDLADPIAHPRRNPVARGLGVAGERLGQEADGRERGPQLVREVVDELRPDLLEPAQLGHVLEDHPDAADG